MPVAQAQERETTKRASEGGKKNRKDGFRKMLHCGGLKAAAGCTTKEAEAEAAEEEERPNRGSEVSHSGDDKNCQRSQSKEFLAWKKQEKKVSVFIIHTAQVFWHSTLQKSKWNRPVFIRIFAELFVSAKIDICAAR
jgi:hypothetical protein